MKPQSHATTPAPASPAIVYALHGNAYINLTSHCTLRCRFCPKFNKQWSVQGYPLRLTTDPTVAEVVAALGDTAPYQEIVFCGLGEPTLRLPELLEIARLLRQRGCRIRLNTDGLANWVYGRDITPELNPVIDALSISLNAQTPELYDRHCRPPRAGAFTALLDFVDCARAQVSDITLTAIDGLPGVDIAACADIARQHGVKFRRRVLHEVG